ncbi:hypothetical protein M9458_033825, partial [Cirrhinus mrigala]
MSDDEATEFYEDEDETFEFDGRPYLFEPEYTEEELRERRERREIERQRLSSFIVRHPCNCQLSALTPVQNKREDSRDLSGCSFVPARHSTYRDYIEDGDGPSFSC